MADFCQWIAEREQRSEEYPPPVLAAVAHYAITDIHRFANGDGRSARLLSSAMLLRHDYSDGPAVLLRSLLRAREDRLPGHAALGARAHVQHRTLA